MLNRLTGSLDFQANALMLRAERQRLIASNIANADTPGYVAREMDFAQALRNATTPAPTPPDPRSLQQTQPGHMSLDLREREGAGTLRYATAAMTNLDSNSVDMDRERASFAENSVKYEATLRFLNGTVRTALDAMKSHTQG